MHVSNSTFKITVNTAQAEFICEALDLYSRLVAGSVEDLPRILAKARPDLVSEKQAEIEEHCQKIETCIPLNFDGVSTTVFDIMQPLRHKLALAKNPQGGKNIKPFLQSNQPEVRVEVS